MSEQLKPCPFCGGKPFWQSVHDADDFGVFWAIRCQGCGNGTQQHFVSNGNDCPEFRAEVRGAWNHRPAAQHNEMHAAIMSLPCVPKWGVNDLTTFEQAYRRGHRDARHAAAELANESDAALSRLRDTQRVLVEALRTAEAILCAHGKPIDPAITAALASVEQQQEQPSHQTVPAGEEVTARDWDGFDEWEDEITHFLLLLASRDDEVGRLAEGLGQFLPELRAAFARKRAAGVALPIEPKENDHG